MDPAKKLIRKVSRCAVCLTLGLAIMLTLVTPASAIVNADEARKVLVNAWRNEASTVDVSAYKITTQEVGDFYRAARNDRNIPWYVDKNYRYHYNNNGYVTSIEPSYYDPAVYNRQAYEAAVYNILSRSYFKGMSSWQAALSVHDYLAANFRYDETYTYYTGYDMAVGGTAVCEGYTRLYMDLMNRIGIPVEYATSEAMDHCWNQLKIGDNWYHVDVTWDDPITDKWGLANHKYFLVSDQMISSPELKHHSWVSDYSSPATNYDEGTFWRELTSPIVYISKDTAILRKDIKTDNGHLIRIYSRDHMSGDETLLCEVTSEYVPINGGNWHFGNSGLSVWDNTIYFSDNNKVYSLPLTGGQPTVIFQYDTQANQRVICSTYVTDEVLFITTRTFDGADGTQQDLYYWLPNRNHTYQRGKCIYCDEVNPNYIPPENELWRIAGTDRFDTSFLVAEQMKKYLGVDKFDAIVVASGKDFADALSGSYLAAVRNAPILLSYKDPQNAKVQEYIRNNLAPGGTVFVLGGTAAVPQSLVDGLSDVKVKRLAGANRFETNLAVLKEAGVAPNAAVLVCTGSDFADCLSAAATGRPILLVHKDLTSAQKNYLSTLANETYYIIGGENAVKPKVYDGLVTLGTTYRLSGKNRYETSVQVAEIFFDNPDAAVLAYARNFPDGLCGGALAASMGTPLILTDNKYYSYAVEYSRQKGIYGGYVLGGAALVADDAAWAIMKAAS